MKKILKTIPPGSTATEPASPDTTHVRDAFRKNGIKWEKFPSIFGFHQKENFWFSSKC